MEGRLHFRLTNSASVTTFAYHPIRREIVTGHEGEIRKKMQPPLQPRFLCPVLHSLEPTPFLQSPRDTPTFVTHSLFFL